ncbi:MULTISPECIES: GDSL-type esterase/lipase family protein [Niastella]|uniref:Prolyl oligopeptidase family serine peptidase n=1 Tax=Niastella soli TaxID=2821487 RepID=A0ABS3YRK4_9BACT|nr:GDSL-type esterase/lipase family protein [Niastella soli]MBO9200527.1 prolyl oligopeptidase family serine peptidase [Niastella soli]
MKKVLAVIAFFIITCAQAQQEIPLYSGEIPGNLSDIDNEKSLTPEKGRPSVINVSQHPELIAFLPKTPNAAKPAVIICPGGGYVRLTIEDGGYEVAKSLADSGVTAFVLKYRTWQDSTFTNYRNLPLNDLEQALELVYNRAAEWNIDTTKIGLLGFSAGGHLAAMGATSKTGKRTAFTILAYPVISFTDSLVSPTLRSRSSLLGKNFTETDKVFYSPELQVSASTPPAFLVHAQDDSTSWVGNSIAYYKALTAKKITGELMIYPKGGHGFAMFNKAMGESWMPQAMKWLHLNGFYKSVTPQPKPAQAPPFYNDILAFKKLDSEQPPAPNGILLIGSSSFTRWKDVNDYFPGYPIINRGFGGSVLTDVIRYAYDIILPYKPKQVLVYCGENDLASGDSITAAQVVQRFKTLFGIIRQNLPNTVISFVSIKPSPVRAQIQPKVKEANKQIQAWIKTQPKAQFIDVYDPMLDAKKQMRAELYVQDRLHMTPEGYAIWKRIITPYLIK